MQTKGPAMSKPTQIRPAADAPEEAPEAQEAPVFDRWIMPYFDDSTLWPVTIVVVAHVVAFVAPVLIFATRDGRLGAMLATAVLFVLSYSAARYEVQIHGRSGAILWTLVATWILSVLAAYYGARTGFL